MRRGLARLANLAGIAAGGALLAVSWPAPAQVRDVDMKAAYIYNFAQFTTWPENRPRPPGAPLSVCADRASVLWPALLAYNGKPVSGRAWQLLDADARPGAAGCDILVLGRAAGAVPAPAVPGLLVVRDGAAGAGTTAAAVTITLIDDDEQLRFDVDTREAARSGLRVSSKLLRLARNVL